MSDQAEEAVPPASEPTEERLAQEAQTQLKAIFASEDWPALYRSAGGAAGIGKLIRRASAATNSPTPGDEFTFERYLELRPAILGGGKK
jgi:hypothetical protein